MRKANPPLAYAQNHAGTWEVSLKEGRLLQVISNRKEWLEKECQLCIGMIKKAKFLLEYLDTVSKHVYN